VSSSDPEAWSRFRVDPRSAAAAPLRASDQDRAVAADVVGSAYAEGRLTRAELDERAEAVQGSRTLGELVPVLADLVPAASDRPPHGARDQAGPLGTAESPDLRARAELAYAAQRQRALAAMLIPTLVCAVVWFTSGFGPGGWEMPYPWPLFVLLGTGIGPLRVVLHHRQIVEAEHARLERKRRKALEPRRTDDA
jgi:hypothetical protein